MNDCISCNPVLNAAYHCQNAHRSIVSETVITPFSPSHFGVSNNQTTKLQGAYLPFLMGLVSFMCNIEFIEFDSNSRINNPSSIIMPNRDLDAADWILRDFTSGYVMRLYLLLHLSRKCHHEFSQHWSIISVTCAPRFLSNRDRIVHCPMTFWRRSFLQVSENADDIQTAWMNCSDWLAAQGMMVKWQIG
jgi:hypothetical protein